MFKKNISVSRTFAYIYIALQIIFALIWACTNLTVYSPERLGKDYLEAARTLVIDDYMGVLYAVFLAPFVAVAENVSLIHTLVSIVQTGIVFGSFLYFCKVFFGASTDKCDRIMLSSFAVTIPMVLQVCFTILPNALILSLALIIISGCFNLLTCDNKKSGITVMVSAFLFSLLLCDYAIVGICALSPFVVCLCFKRKKKALIYAAVSVIIMLAGFGIGRSRITSESYGRVERTVSVYMHQRFSYPYLYDYISDYKEMYGFDAYGPMTIAEGIPEKFFEDYLMELKNVNENVLSDGTLDMTVRKALKSRKRDIVSSLSFDLASYFAPAISICFIKIKSVSDTLFPRVYTSFIRKLPAMSEIYFWFFEFSSLIAVVLSVISRKKERATKNLKPIIYFAYVMAVSSVYYSFFAVRGFDYRNASFALSVPMIFVFYNLLDKRTSL